MFCNDFAILIPAKHDFLNEFYNTAFVTDLKKLLEKRFDRVLFKQSYSSS